MTDYTKRLLKSIWDCDAHDISATEGSILICIAACSEGEGIGIPLSIRQIAKRCKLSEGYICKKISSLLRKGYLNRVTDPTPTEAAEYLINIELIKENTWGLKHRE